MKCPYCEGEIEALRGKCPHCQKDLNADGFRAMLEGNAESAKRAEGEIADLKKVNEGMVTRVATLEDKLKERMEIDANTDSEDKPKPCNIMQVVRACAAGSFEAVGAEYERDVIQEHADRMRALSTGAVGTGGAIVPPEYLPQEFIELLRAQIVVEALGARVLNDLTGSPVLIPKLASGAIVGDVAENAAKPDDDQTFEELNLVPTECAGATIYSKRMAMMSNPSVDRMIIEDLTSAIAERIDLLAMIGTGAASQPVGIINVPGIGTYTLINDVGNGAVPVPDDIDDSQLVLQTANAFKGNLGWASHPRTFNTFKKMRTDSGAGAGTGGYLYPRSEFNAQRLDGLNFRPTTQLPVNVVKGGSNDTTYLILGNFNDLILAYWGGLEVATSDQAEGTFLKNQIIIKVSMLYDVAVRHEESFVVIDGVRA